MKRSRLAWPGAHHELISLFAVATIFIIINQLFDDLNLTLISLLVASYFSANIVVVLIRKEPLKERLLEHGLLSVIIWFILSSLV